MDEQVVITGANDREFVCMFCDVGKKAGNIKTRLAMFLEGKSWRHDLAINRVYLCQIIGVKILGQELAVVPGHLWFWVKSFQMAWPTLHEQENHMLCPRSETGDSRRKQVCSLALGCEIVTRQ